MTRQRTLEDATWWTKGRLTVYCLPTDDCSLGPKLLIILAFLDILIFYSPKHYIFLNIVKSISH